MKYYTRTVRIGVRERDSFDMDTALDKEVNYIYSQGYTVVSMTITPIIGTHEGLRIVDEYWIVYVYC